MAGGTDPTQPPAGGTTDLGTLDTMLRELNKEITKFSLANFAKNSINEILSVQKSIDGLNAALLGTRTRLTEMGKAITDAMPGIAALGGDLKDAQTTLAEIASGSRRNVIATRKDVEELYSVGKLTGKNVVDIVDSFGKVGMSYKKIGENVAGTINTANSLGVNARTVMSSVLDNTEKLQRFNFENGVQGLSRMAAQASMLRFDMNETFKLADDVLDPERAVEVASAFQRLGVSAGNLVDPFQLMNQSINDPSGLQDSLINIGKQFTYFDEKTKSYKINPQGILTLKEIGKQTGVSADELRKAALSAADFDERLSAVSKADLFPEVTEDDKKLLANMARMGDTPGSYEISVGGEYKEISQLNSQQLKQLVEEQKKGPKTVEEIQKSTLEIDKSLLANAKEINAKLSKTLFFSDKSLQNSLDFTKGIREAGKESAGRAMAPDFEKDLREKQAERARAKTAGDTEKVKRLDKEITDMIQRDMRLAMKAFQDGIGKSGDVVGSEVGKTLNNILTPAFDVAFGRSASMTEAGTAGATPIGGTRTPINAPSNQINPEWIYGTSQRVQQMNNQNQSNQQQTPIDVSNIPTLPKRIDVYFNKPANVDFSSIEEALSSGILKIEEATFTAVEKTAKRLGKQSRL